MSRPAVPPPLPEPSRRVSPPPEAPEESPNFFDERFDFEEPFDLLEASESPTAAAEAPAETTEPPEEKRPRRRRRRRRGRGDQGRESREGVAPAADDDRAAHLTPAATEGEFDRGSLADQHEVFGPSQGPGEAKAGESEERRTHRRSRHGRNRGDRETAVGAAGAAREPRAGAPPPVSPERDMLESDLLVGEGIELGEGDQHDDQQGARLGFRGIPTWQEVVGMLVTKNVEARSRRPAGGPHHGRGNRGPRDNRGNQGGKRQPS